MDAEIPVRLWMQRTLLSNIQTFAVNFRKFTVDRWVVEHCKVTRWPAGGRAENAENVVVEKTDL